MSSLLRRMAPFVGAAAFLVAFSCGISVRAGKSGLEPWREDSVLRLDRPAFARVVHVFRKFMFEAGNPDDVLREFVLSTAGCGSGFECNVSLDSSHVSVFGRSEIVKAAAERFQTVASLMSDAGAYRARLLELLDEGSKSAPELLGAATRGEEGAGLANAFRWALEELSRSAILRKTGAGRDDWLAPTQATVKILSAVVPAIPPGKLRTTIEAAASSGEALRSAWKRTCNSALKGWCPDGPEIPWEFVALSDEGLSIPPVSALSYGDLLRTIGLEQVLLLVIASLLLGLGSAILFRLLATQWD